MAPTLSSAAILSAIGLGSKAFLNYASKDFRVEGLQHLLKALEEGPGDKKGKGKGWDENLTEAIVTDKGERRRRRGIVTICNHISVVDDPMLWGMMPMKNFFPFASPRHMSRHARWTLGASDIMFTNPLFSKFFNLGQVIETVRGGGIFQPAIDEAVQKLQKGEWIHVFPEGKVNQVTLNPEGGLRRFKWGVSRIIMDSEVMPEIIPIWISGFEDIMPDDRKYLRGFPRPGKRASVTVGPPVTSLIEPIVAEWKRLAGAEGSKIGVGGTWGSQQANEKTRGLLEGIQDAQTKVDIAAGQQERQHRGGGTMLEGKERDIRIQICDLLFKELQTLGLRIEKEEGKDKREWRNAVPVGWQGKSSSDKSTPTNTFHDD